MTERERLIELLNIYNPGLKSENIADYLLKNGVVVLPCKVGDVVYCLEDAWSGDEIVKVVKAREINALGVHKLDRLEIEAYDTKKVHLYLSNFGETVFLTKEEAEKALKRSELEYDK